VFVAVAAALSRMVGIDFASIDASTGGLLTTREDI
jgi:hypothetical protein